MNKKILIRFFFFLTTILFLKISVYAAYTVGKPWFHTYVDDNENLISSDTSKKLESDFEKLKNDTTVAVYIITTDKLEGLSVEKYCEELVSNWQIKGKYVILLTSTEERQYRLLASKDLQPYISMNNIKDFSSYLNSKKYNEGFLYASNNIISVINSNSNKIKPADNSSFIWLLVLAVVVIYYIKSTRIQSFHNPT